MKQPSWSDEEVAVLCDGIAEGETFREVKKKLPRRTVNACIGKFHRIGKMMDDFQAKQEMMRKAA